MEKNNPLPLKNFLLAVVTSLFVSLPFFYLYMLAKYQNSFIFNHTWPNYALAIVLGLVLALYCAKSLRSKISLESREILLLILKIAVFSYGLYLLFLTISGYNRFISETVDVAYYHYALWQLSEFKIPYIWDGMLSEAVWSQHFEPILFL